MWQKLSKYFFNGLITLLPLFITIWILKTVYSLADNLLGNFITPLIGRKIPGIGFLITIVVIFIIGFLASKIIGNKIIQLIEKNLLLRLPIIKPIYSAVKQINEALFSKKEESQFNRVCLVEYPRKGIYSIGFISADAPLIVEKHTGKKMFSIFIPNSPTPATGFTIMVPADDVTILGMTTEEAFKYYISAGVLTS